MTYFKSINFDPTVPLETQYSKAHSSASFGPIRPGDYNSVVRVTKDHFASFADTGNHLVVGMELPQPLVKGHPVNFQYGVVNVIVSPQERIDLKERFRRRCEHYGVYATAMTLAHGDLYMFTQRHYLHVAYVTDVQHHPQYLQKLVQTVFWGATLERFGFILRGKGLYKTVGEEQVCITKEWVEIQSILTGGSNLQSTGHRRDYLWESIFRDAYFQKDRYPSAEHLPTHELLTALGVDMSDFLVYISRKMGGYGNPSIDWKRAIDSNPALSPDQRRMIWGRFEEADMAVAIKNRLSAIIEKIAPGISSEESNEARTAFKESFSGLNEYYLFSLSSLPSTLEARIKPFCEAYIKPTEVEGAVVEDEPAVQAPEIPAEVAKEVSSEKPVVEAVEEKKTKRRATKKTSDPAKPVRAKRTPKAEVVETSAGDHSFSLAA